ncbi:hypothetical protein LTS08_001795 [Lithohypha guttulata]|nr:hypothetical protein LTS08_001795 [Lithohypha guttulata]
MADSDLKARSLDSLLALTPAKNMFGEDVSDQWKRKKQTPEQKKAARMAKLDPANWKTAKDVYDERSAEAAKKRKLDDTTNASTQQTTSTESDHASKRQKKDNAQPEKRDAPTGPIGEIAIEDVINPNLKKKLKKRAHRSEKNAQKRRETEEVKAGEGGQQSSGTEAAQATAHVNQQQHTRKQIDQSSSKKVINAMKKAKEEVDPISPFPNTNRKQKDSEEHDLEPEDIHDIEMADVDESVENDIEKSTDEDIEVNAGENQDLQDDQSTATSTDGISDVLSPPQDSASSSVSSILPLIQSGPSNPKKPKPAVAEQVSQASNNPTPLQTDSDREAARERLQQQISQFRSQRKADDRPIRSRADLLEQRRRKEQERKAAKKEQRQKEREEEAKRQDEEIARRFSPGGSGSLLASPRSPMADDGGSSFSFGRIAFEDGTQFDPSTSSAAAQKRHKGPSDAASALKAAQAKDARIAGLDEGKKQDIADKDMWLNARKRAHGERVKDDTSLLKKALKRQEKQKQRSGKDWETRVEGVRSSQEAKQKKRTENTQKRKDEKLGKKSGPKKVKRPGFEGSFRGRTGKGKKK